MKHKHSFIHLNLTWHPLILQTYGELRSGQVNVTKPKFIFSRIFLSNHTTAVLLAKEFNPCVFFDRKYDNLAQAPFALAQGLHKVFASASMGQSLQVHMDASIAQGPPSTFDLGAHPLTNSPL